MRYSLLAATKGRWRVLLCAIVALLLFHPPATSAALRVTDDFGRAVILPKAATRIVSLAPHITENLFSAGAGNKVVGRTQFCDYPPATTQIPIVGDGNSNINLEMILTLKPDLVVAWQNTQNRTALKQIADWGIPIYYSEPRTLNDIIDNIAELAYLADTESRINPPLQTLRRELAQARTRYADAAPRTFFYQIWQQPLLTLNGEHYLSRALGLCGAQNIFADLPILAPQVSVEAVLARSPDIIITSVESDAQLARWSTWDSIPAVRNNHFIRVDGKVMHRHTARMLRGISGLCQRIARLRNEAGSD